MDAHEKLAKVYGIWVHGCIDGYSRYIIYLKAAPDKTAETVRAIFVTGCEEEGWSSRVRADKGSENVEALVEQIDYHHVEGRPETLYRGSVITGPSPENCRIEGLWPFVKDKVVMKFRIVFNELRTQGLFDATSKEDRFCLHVIFMPVVQEALDNFREMWNNHVIRGPRTVAGRGGGIPADLFCDAVYSSAVQEADARLYQPGRLGPDARGRNTIDETSRFGAEDPLSIDAVDMMEKSLPLGDPLGFSPLLQRVRDAYVATVHLTNETVVGPQSSTWEKFEPRVQSYIRYKTVNSELLECALAFRIDDDDDDDFDFESFGASQSPDAYAAGCGMRLDLGAIGAAERVERARRREEAEAGERAEAVERARRVLEEQGYDLRPPEEQ